MNIDDMSFEDLNWAITLVEHPPDMPHEVAMRQFAERLIEKFPQRAVDVVRIMNAKAIPVGYLESVVRCALKTCPESGALLEKYLPDENTKTGRHFVPPEPLKSVDFKQLAASWTPVATMGRKLDCAVKKWTPSGLQCLELNGDCAKCPIHQATGLTWDVAATHQKKCFQPIAVQILLDEGKRPALSA